MKEGQSIRFFVVVEGTGECKLAAILNGREYVAFTQILLFSSPTSLVQYFAILILQYIHTI